MEAIKNAVVQTSKRQEAEEMIKMFLNMTALDRAKVFGYAQGVESMTGKIPERQAG